MRPPRTPTAPPPLRYQTGPGLMNYAELADALGYFDDVELDKVGHVQGGPQALRALASNQIDFATAFHGAIAQVVATGVPITAVASTTAPPTTWTCSSWSRTRARSAAAGT